MRVPAHAAVGESVALVRSAVGAGAAGLTNAVLRKVGADDEAGWLARVAPPVADGLAEHLAVVSSHPLWVVRALREALAGRGASDVDDELRALLDADNDRPLVTLVARPGLSDVGEPARGRGAARAVVADGGGAAVR
ncbi:hypothetical protein GCM10025868_03420 [Angustibacter aerolatus]|uniref:NusB/RsmB/TIM44 domain-containing protein n=1 Tax=Angustibacter aerolatus TaxID=1162965 RepID=A0ABQ6JA82_9ACTN|nr:hypothetical protein GCM10025868_03420 [Angustibacter aerolatus]